MCLVAILMIMAPNLSFAASLGKFATFDEKSTSRINHGPFNALLKKYRVQGADGIARTRYAKFTAKDRSTLKAYLEDLEKITITRASKPEQFAYWVNFYNALTLAVVLGHYPVKSIKDIRISPGLFSSGPWGKKLVTVEGVALSLDDMEHEILRKFWHDKRIHYAVSCASIGCPNLAAIAYTARNTNQLLDAGARTYINHPRGVSIKNNALTVSKIYKWYAEDFGSKTQLMRHFQRYANPALKARLKKSARIEAYIYNWNLNDAAH